MVNLLLPPLGPPFPPPAPYRGHEGSLETSQPRALTVVGLAQEGAAMRAALTYVTTNMSPNTSHRLQMRDTVRVVANVDGAGEGRHVLSRQVGIWV